MEVENIANTDKEKDALELEVREEAKRLYALSDQGKWENLPGWMQAFWMAEAAKELGYVGVVW